MRKRIVSPKLKATVADQLWLELERNASVEVTSEDYAFPIESALSQEATKGWRGMEQQLAEQHCQETAYGDTSSSASPSETQDATVVREDRSHSEDRAEDDSEASPEDRRFRPPRSVNQNDFVTALVPSPLAAYRMPACHGRHTHCLPALPLASTCARYGHHRRRNTHRIRAS
jgi:hypothetical protein